jgi:predicted Zn-dependent protease
LQACYRITAGIEAFESLKKSPQFSSSGEPQHWRTHPLMEARIAAMKALVPKLLHESPCHYEQELRAAMAAALKQ